MPKASEFGVAVKGRIPVPVRLTLCGLPAELSVTVTDAVLAAAVAGVKVTKMEQVPPGATLAPQVLVSENSVRFAPVMAMLEIVSAPDPGLESVIVFATLVVLMT